MSCTCSDLRPSRVTVCGPLALQWRRALRVVCSCGHATGCATAHKIARTVYHLLKNRVQYHDIGAAEYNQRFREREMPYLQKKVAKLGDTLTPA